MTPHPFGASYIPPTDAIAASDSYTQSFETPDDSFRSVDPEAQVPVVSINEVDIDTSRYTRQKSVTLQVYDDDEDMENSMIDFDTKARQLSQHLIVPKSKQPVESQPQQAEMSAKNLNWMRLIIEFFELQNLATREKEAALRIEEFFCNIRRQRVRTRFLKLHYKHQGLQCSMRSLPRELLVKIASFLAPKELLSKFCGVSKVFKSVSQSPNLWRNISTFAQKESGQFLHNYNYLMQLVSRST